MTAGEQVTAVGAPAAGHAAGAPTVEPFQAWAVGVPEVDVLAPTHTGLGASDIQPVAPNVVPRAFRRSSGVTGLWLHAAGLTPPTGHLVSITSADGGVGRSTLTAGLGAVLAAACPGPVLAVDATLRRWGGLEHRVTLGNANTIRDAADQLPDWAPDADFASLTQQGTAGLQVLVGEPGVDGRRLPTFDELAPIIALARERYALTVLDLPTADAPWAVPSLWSATCPVLVARATTESLHHTMRLLAELRDRGLGAVARRAVIVVMGTAPHASRDVLAAQRQLRLQVDDVIRVPFDPQLARSSPVEPGQLRRTTLTALVAVASAVLARCPTQPEPPIWHGRATVPPTEASE